MEDGVVTDLDSEEETRESDVEEEDTGEDDEQTEASHNYKEWMVCFICVY